jgi:hypothetical protein
LIAGAAALLSAVLIAVILRVLPRPHSRFAYLIAGTAAAAVWLTAALAHLERNGLLNAGTTFRTVRRSGP